MRRSFSPVLRKFALNFSLKPALLAALTALALTGFESTARVARGAYNLLPFTGPSPVPGETPILKGASVASSRGVPIDKGRLTLTMTLTPSPVRLSDVRHIEVTMQVKNVSKRFVQMEFPTSQRIEILVRDERNQLVTQWSEDRAFDPGTSYVGINPGEHIEYKTAISTRDLKAGRHYKVLGFFPNFEELRAEKVITPLP